MWTSTSKRSMGIKAAVLTCSLLSVGTLGGCNNAGEGLFSGAALGAVTGLALGSLSGNAGEGAAIGAIVGGAGGAIIGDQNERSRENAYIQSRGGTTHVVVREYPYCSVHRVHHHCDAHGHYHYDQWWCD